MLRLLRLWLLKNREAMLEGQVDQGEVLIHDHMDRLQRAKNELRRVRQQIATNENPQTLLAQALRSQALR